MTALHSLFTIYFESVETPSKGLAWWHSAFFHLFFPSARDSPLIFINIIIVMLITADY